MTTFSDPLKEAISAMDDGNMGSSSNYKGWTFCSVSPNEKKWYDHNYRSRERADRV